MKTLNQIIKEQNLGVETQEIKNYGTDKHIHSYTDGYYEKKFSNIKNDKIILVEIGVRGGASIQLWKIYFSNAKIFGLDNFESKDVYNVPINENWISGDNVEFIIGDAYSSEIANKISEDIDILIDDGPHTFESHVKLLELYIPKMKKGGTIIIEDISYDYNMLNNFLPETHKNKLTVYDFGEYDNRLIELVV